MTALIPVQREGDHLAALVAAFLEDKRRASVHTADAYRRDLALWLDWCRANHVHPLEARPGHVRLWSAALADRGDSANTRGRRLSAVSSWYGYLIENEVVERNPAAIVGKRPKRTPRRRAPAMSDQQAAALLAAADSDSRRAAAIVWLMLYSGIRVGELIGANVSDLGTERGHPVLHVHGKGGMVRTVPLVPPVVTRLDAYLSSRDDAPSSELVPVDQAGAGRDRPLIATANGRRLDRKAVRLLLKRLAVKAGLPEVLVDRLSPHSTRATYATAALDDGVPVRDVQYALGHASPVTTEGYDRSQLSPERSPAYRLLARFTPCRM